jgi:glycosyltransferase involved in cell wall biosynthesis
MNNLHISLTSFQNESRLLKQGHSLLSNGLFSTVFVAALHEEGLKEEESVKQHFIANRFKLVSRSWGTNIFIRLLKYIEYCLRVSFFYKKKGIEVINVHSIALLPLGVFLKYIYKAKLIYDAHELETESNGLKGSRQKIAKIIERYLIFKVDGIIVVSESIADWYQNEYNIARPTVVMNAPLYQVMDKKNIFREELNIAEDVIIFLYQGALTPGRGISLIIEAFESTTLKNIAVIFMGYGSLRSEILDASKVNSNIYFYPAVSPDVVLSYTCSADVGFSLAENRCLSYQYSMPNKMFEYTMAGIPIIASNMTDISDFISKFNLGLILETDTSCCLLSAVETISANGVNFYNKNCIVASKQYSWEIQEIKMLHSYKNWGVKGTL